MNMLNLNEIVELKSQVKSRFGVTLHFHDACPKAFFTLDKQSRDAEKFIEEFLSQRKLFPRFSDDRLQCVLIVLTKK